MGGKRDLNIRSTQKRIDNHAHKHEIEMARRHIYGQKNFAVNSAAVERVLAGKSLVPTNVSNPQTLDPTVVQSKLSLNFRMHFPSNLEILNSFHFKCWLLTSCMNLS